MGTLITIAQVVLSLSILVVLHECGHFFPAKWFKTKVEKFYLFFNPWFSLYKKQVGETEYGIGWLPMGGYVKIAGMIDESMDKDQMQGPVQPWEFRAKKSWQRLIIMIGGVTVNFILGFFIYAMIAWTWGTEYVPNENVSNGISVDSIGYEMGLRDGDKIISVGGVSFDRFHPGTFKKEIIVNDAQEAIVERNGVNTSVSIDPKYSTFLSKQDNQHFSLFTFRVEAVIDSLRENSIAQKAGLQKSDRIISLNDQEVADYNGFTKLLDKAKGSDMQLQIERNGIDTIPITAMVPEGKPLGIFVALPEPAYEKYGFLESFPKGFSTGMGFLNDQFKAFGQMFRGRIKAKDSLGSIISIGRQFGTDWDWRRFWSLTAALSLILAVINLLPIPALDGGYVLFLFFEMITGIKPSDKFMEYTTTIGFILLMLLMVFALGLDVSRLF